MKKIEAIVSPGSLDSITERLCELGIRSVVISQATCLGEPLQRRRVYRGSCYTVDAAQLVKLEFIASDELLESVLASLGQAIDTPSVAACAEVAVLVMNIERVITRAIPTVAQQGAVQRVREAARPGWFETVAAAVTGVAMRRADE